MPIESRNLTIPARDGFPLSARLFLAERPAGAVLVSAGTGFPKGFYERFARHAQSKGLTALTYDFRGIAGSRPDDLAALKMDYPDWGRLDMPAAVDALAAAAPGLPLLHVGHSVGGHFVGFMDNQARLARHAFVSVGSGYWGGHHRSYNPLELFFWFGFGPLSLARRGYVKGGGLWAGTDLPRGVFETWRRWCLNPRYFEDELKDRLRPHQFDAVSAPIRSWIFTDDPIATPETARRLMRVYPHAPWDMVVTRPADLGATRVGHEGAFRRGMEPLWDQILGWLVEDAVGGPT
ncbi:MAG TPA: alpha/beta hydrolase [Brevundimonas sp.]|jgi:predicted alpha/beta hydrolase|uniref:alpha/beta hydrolase family protein n=1 Tax=Brevundimonas sp. TaxID=1871086 RepID=UPI002DEDC32F|nr:alpha/beta hydrolase [Brevundimonas sp.]